ncbi:MAG: metallophosphoesterase family protein [Acidimicrobiia bacterium]|nr:metallophosphoesterase family protein [Acidimicrobiia bacterium]
MRWFTADLHLGHTNVIGYTDRPFADAAEMDEALVRAWNEVVDVGDEVWVLGDVAMGRIAETLPNVARLVGTKHLVLGNHDRPFDAGRRGEEWTDRYLDAGFAELHHGSVELEVAGTPVLLCHFPYRGDSGTVDRYLDQRPLDDGRWLLHGHVHEKWRQHDRMVNVGVDAWSGRPVAEPDLAALIAAGPDDPSPLPWAQRRQPAT